MNIFEIQIYKDDFFFQEGVGELFIRNEKQKGIRYYNQFIDKQKKYWVFLVRNRDYIVYGIFRVKGDFRIRFEDVLIVLFMVIVVLGQGG